MVGPDPSHMVGLFTVSPTICIQSVSTALAGNFDTVAKGCIVQGSRRKNSKNFQRFLVGILRSTGLSAIRAPAIIACEQANHI